jgi:ribosomal protein S18 acetylase RimI-like enzyme
MSAKSLVPMQIRSATPDDASILMVMLEALAAHEGESSALTEEKLAIWLGDGLLQGWLAETGQGDDPLGCVLSYRGYDLASGTAGRHLTDLFVWPQCRRQGVGHRLVTAVAEAVTGEGGAWISWTLSRDNAAARMFYQSLGARDRREVGFMTLSGQALMNCVP